MLIRYCDICKAEAEEKYEKIRLEFCPKCYKEFIKKYPHLKE